ncbi:MAG TPA: DNA-binding domain-containing protein [Pirellulaceae bacterium]|nr:DNA-binding domain-containing protein [Pirellulaceae bacterium]
MNVSVQSLGELQHWLLDAITLPEDADPAGVAAAIVPSRNQSSAERLAVYRHAYLARLLEVLRELFPCTRFAVGDELFDQFAAGYLQQYPPHSYTLARLADRWVEHLDETRPANAEWGRFIVELSRLEQAIDRIFDGPGPENLPPFTLPANASGDLQLSFVPGFELNAFQFPISDFYTAWKAGEHPSWPTPREQFLALFRRDHIVRRHELSREQYALLSAIQRGQTLGRSLGELRDYTPERIRRWFTNWSASRFFASVPG